MTRTIDTLLTDIKTILERTHVPDERNLDALSEGIKNAVRDKLKREGNGKFNLRFSNIGYPDRYLWYSSRVNPQLEAESILDYSTVLKFLIGDIYESVILFLIKEAGHVVTDEQKAVHLEGLNGRMDAKVDGVPIDVKSASSVAFRQKFVDNKLVHDDHFGYLAQISGYAQGDPDHDDTKGVAILGANKESGELALIHLDPLELIDAPKRIRDARAITSSDVLPERCYRDVDEGKSGNKRLAKSCIYCPFKFECWSDANDGKGLRVFKYSNELRYLTSVVNEPRVEEITIKKADE